MTTLSARLAEIRQVAGLSASELGSLAGLSRATVSMIEAGKRPDPAASTIASLATVLGDCSNYLISGGEPPTEATILAAVDAARRRQAPTEAASGSLERKPETGFVTDVFGPRDPSEPSNPTVIVPTKEALD